MRDDLAFLDDSPLSDTADTPDDFGLDGIFGDDFVETTQNVSARAIRLDAKRSTLRVTQKENLRDVIQTPPRHGEQIHVVSANKFDFWTWVPVMTDWIGKADRLYVSTWTTNRVNTRNMFELWDAGKIGTSDWLVGLYFKRRETNVYAMLLEGLAKRGGRIRAFETHAKVVLLNNKRRNTWLTIEGSANMTANPRLEQYVITNDKRLWTFHQTWFEEMLDP
jgi:hypothetical protein